MNNLRAMRRQVPKAEENEPVLSALRRIEKQLSDVLRQTQSEKEALRMRFSQDVALYEEKSEAIRLALLNFRQGGQGSEETLLKIEKILSEKVVPQEQGLDIQKLIELNNMRLRDSKDTQEDLQSCLKELGI